MKYDSTQSVEQIHQALKAGSRVSFDGDLYIICPKTIPENYDGSKGYWRFDYTYQGRRLTISAGTYPKTDIERAKHRASVYRAMVSNGLNPSEERKLHSSDAEMVGKHAKKFNLQHPHCLEAIAMQWAKDSSKNCVPKTLSNKIDRIKKYILPNLGHKHLDEIRIIDIRNSVSAIVDAEKLPTAEIVANIWKWIYKRGMSLGLLTENRANVAIDGICFPPAEREHFPAITNPNELGHVLRKIHSYDRTFPVQCALKLLPMLFVRPGNLRQAVWDDFDLVKKVWRLPAQKMKSSHVKKENGKPHYVPLSDQAVDILYELYEVTGSTGVLFPSIRGRSRFVSDGTFNKALRQCGIDTKKHITAHGFRAAARTIIEEQLETDNRLVELQLDHKVKRNNGGAYDRAELIIPRARLMQSWSSTLVAIRNGEFLYEDPYDGFMSITQRQRLANTATEHLPLTQEQPDFKNNPSVRSITMDGLSSPTETKRHSTSSSWTHANVFSTDLCHLTPPAPHPNMLCS